MNDADDDKGGGVRDHHSYSAVVLFSNSLTRRPTTKTLAMALEKVERANKSLGRDGRMIRFPAQASINR